jgi:hypothetical protein
MRAWVAGLYSLLLCAVLPVLFSKLCMYTMATEPISTAYFSLYVYPPSDASQRLGKNVTAATNTYATEQLLDVAFVV